MISPTGRVRTVDPIPTVADISIVVAIAKFDYLPEFFESLAQATDPAQRVEVIVMDNVAQQERFHRLVVQDPKPRAIRVVYNDPPLDLHASWNLGVKIAVGEVIVVCNDDLHWGPRSLANCCAALRLNNLRCVYPTHTSGAKLLSPPPGSGNPAALPKLVGPPEFRGFCMVMTREGVEAVARPDGLFDEAYQLYYGDDDLCMRFIRVGSPARQVDNAWIHHYESQSHDTRSVGFTAQAREYDYQTFVKRWEGRTIQGYLKERGF